MSLKLDFNEMGKSENELVQWLCKYVVPRKRGICYIEDPFVYNKGIKKMIESLYRTRFTLLEDLGSNTYVVVIPSGFLDMAYVTLVLKLEQDNLYIAGYAREGLIKQNLYEKALNKIKTILGNDKIHF